MAFAPVQPGGIIQAPTINNLVSAIDWFSADTGTATVYRVTFDGVTGANKNTISTLTNGLIITFRAVNANTGAATVQVVGAGSVVIATPAITRNGGTALVAGDIQAGQVVVLIYNATSTRFEMQNASRIAATSITTGTLPVARGGTGLAAFALGSFPYASAANVLSARTIGTTGQVLGVVGGLPTWVNESKALAVKVVMSADQSIASGSYVSLNWSTAQFDTNAFFAVGTPSRLTIPAGLAGKYSIIFKSNFTVNATGGRFARLMKNGASIEIQGAANAAPTGNDTYIVMTTILDLAAGDFIEAACSQASGAALAIKASDTFLSMAYLGT